MKRVRAGDRLCFVSRAVARDYGERGHEVEDPLRVVEVRKRGLMVSERHGTIVKVRRKDVRRCR